MKRNGYFPSKPIQCYRREDGKLVVVDGHHRLAAAASLGLVIFYVEEAPTSQDSMPDSNIVAGWKITDFIRMYAMRGSGDYQLLESYVARGFPATMAASLLRGESATSGNANILVRSGLFKVRTTTDIDAIYSLMGSSASSVFKNNNFIKALSLCLWLPEFDFALFKKRAIANHHMIPKCSNVDDFLNAIEAVYNFRAQDKQPIALNAKKAAKMRSAVNQ